VGNFASLLATLNAGAIGVFGTAATYQPPTGPALQIQGIILASGMPESKAPGYFCDFFVSVGANPGELPFAPVRYVTVILNGVAYYVNDVTADKVGNGYRLILNKNFP
jgi:hypothetical protein